jgi:hypothetical protein
MLVFAVLIASFNVAAVKRRSRASEAAPTDPPHGGIKSSMT